MRNGYQPSHSRANPTPPTGGSGVMPPHRELVERAARALCDHVDACGHINSSHEAVDYIATALTLSRRLRQALAR